MNELTGNKKKIYIYSFIAFNLSFGTDRLTFFGQLKLLPPLFPPIGIVRWRSSTRDSRLPPSINLVSVPSLLLRSTPVAQNTLLLPPPHYLTIIMDLANLLHAAPKRACPEPEYPAYKRSPQPPLSPPVEEQPKCSLPSITALLEGADGHAASEYP